MALLPRGLTDLDCCLAYEEFDMDFDDPTWNSDWAQAPPHLTRVNALQTYARIPHLKWLPRTLTDCRMYMQLWTPSHALTAPPLTSLHLSCTIELSQFQDSGLNFIESLPRSLTSLVADNLTELAPCFPNGLILCEELDQLDTPTLELTSEQDAQFRAMRALWPPRLKTCKLTLDEMRFVELLILPNSITDLRLSSAPPRHSMSRYPSKRINAKWFPSNLVELDICSIWEVYELTFVNSLPSSLQCLRLKRQGMETMPRRIDVPLFDQVAPSLTALSTELYDINFGDKPSQKDSLRVIDWSLPSRLTQLRTGIFPYEWFKFLPRSVVDFNFAVEYVPSEDIDVFADLPTGMERIWIADSEKHDGLLSSRCFSTLHNLKLLHCESMIFPSSVIRNLAKSLESLILVLDNFEEENAVHLPQRLETLLLSGFTWTNKPWIAQYWPIRAIEFLYDPKLTDAVRKRAYERSN